MSKWFLILCAVGCLLWGAAWAEADPVRVEFFFEPGCAECEDISVEILPELGRRFGDKIELVESDVGVEANFLHLLQLMNACGWDGAERPYLIVNDRHAFGNPLGDSAGFFQQVEVSLGQSALAPPVADPRDDLVRSRFDSITLPVVLFAGLIDGLNPCAISTLVFFMSLLAVSKVRKRRLLWMGASFCVASFLTYLALGLGVLRAFHLLAGASMAREIVEWGMAAFLLVLGIFSFRDAIRFKHSQKGSDVMLQLSTGMKKRIHRVMHRGVGFTHVIAGGLLIGTLVTLLESVCTGQVYVPTLVYILKNNEGMALRALGYLVVYNLLFVLPLLIVFIATYRGLQTQTLLAWSRKNLVLSKTLLGLLFVALAILIAWV